VLRTIVSGHKTLGSKLLHGRLRTMREKQHVPAAVSHLEDVPCRWWASKGGWGDRGDEMLNNVASERRRLEENEGFTDTQNHFCRLPCSFLIIRLGLRTNSLINTA
jgi:hypothetical protein